MPATLHDKQERPIVYGLVSPLAGTVSDRFGTRSIILIGLVLMTFGCLAMGTFDAQLSVLGYILRVVPWAMGLGMFLPPNNSATMGAAPKEHLGIASGLASLSRMLGQVTGVPLLGAVFSTLTLARTQPTDISIIDVTNAPVEALVFGVQTTFRIAALLVMILIIVAVILWKLEKTRALAASRPSH